jgi:hypothetical protein
MERSGHVLIWDSTLTFSRSEKNHENLSMDILQDDIYGIHCTSVFSNLII